MSINNFLTLTIQDGLLVASGETLGDDEVPQRNAADRAIHVSVIPADDIQKCVDLTVADPFSTPWVATSANADHGCVDGDAVYVNGVVISPVADPLQWTQPMTVGPSDKTS